MQPWSHLQFFLISTGNLERVIRKTTCGLNSSLQATTCRSTLYLTLQRKNSDLRQNSFACKIQWHTSTCAAWYMGKIQWQTCMCVAWWVMFIYIVVCVLHGVYNSVAQLYVCCMGWVKLSCQWHSGAWDGAL